MKKSPINISEMTGKLNGVDAINTSPLNNSFCMMQSKNPENICYQCYSIKMLSTFRKSCDPSFRRNGEVLSTRLLTIDEIFGLKFKFNQVRFNAHGELQNLGHAINCIRIATLHPTRNFALYTKRPSLVAQAVRLYGLPENLQLIYSSIKINVPSNRPVGFHKVFNVWNRDVDTTKVNINCCDGVSDRHCADCKNCYTGFDVAEVNELVATDKSRSAKARSSKKLNAIKKAGACLYNSFNPFEG
jgi:hypothetical protein